MPAVTMTYVAPTASTSSTAASVAMLRALATAKNESKESSEKTAIRATRISPIWVLEPAASLCRVEGGRSSSAIRNPRGT